MYFYYIRVTHVKLWHFYFLIFHLPIPTLPNLLQKSSLSTKYTLGAPLPRSSVLTWKSPTIELAVSEVQLLKKI